MDYLTKQEFNEFDNGLDARIENKIDDRFEQFIEGPFADLRSDVENLRTDMQFEFSEVRREMKEMDKKIDDKFNTIINKIDGFLGEVNIVGTETTMAHVRIDRLEARIGFAP